MAGVLSAVTHNRPTTFFPVSIASESGSTAPSTLKNPQQDNKQLFKVQCALLLYSTLQVRVGV